MEEERKPDGFGEIEKLIGEEKARAVEAFRRGDFLSRLEAKIGRAAGSTRPEPVLIRRPLLRLAAGALALAVIYLLVSNIKRPSPAGRNIFEIALGPISNLEEPAGRGV